MLWLLTGGHGRDGRPFGPLASSSNDRKDWHRRAKRLIAVSVVCRGRRSAGPVLQRCRLFFRPHRAPITAVDRAEPTDPVMTAAARGARRNARPSSTTRSTASNAEIAKLSPAPESPPSRNRNGRLAQLRRWPAGPLPGPDPCHAGHRRARHSWRPDDAVRLGLAARPCRECSRQNSKRSRARPINTPRRRPASTSEGLRSWPTRSRSAFWTSSTDSTGRT